MSSSYSANQYESAFRSQRLQNWGDTKSFKKKTTLTDGNSTFIANDRGHLLPGLVKRGSAWPDLMYVWDLPARIPARHINPTARSAEGLHRLRSWGFDPQQPEGRQPLGISRNSQRLKDDEHITAEVQDSNVPSTSTGAHLISQNHPVSGGDHNQEDTVVGAVTSSTEEKQKRGPQVSIH
ncbi:protein Flattop [Cynoglossus semilaevis]|uniref:Protein Flattop n=1 Tax=Cynoglossus semilaevis TaxID=244447 RepID=A0A3P8UTH3_CYNSE|nr:protein Flattop [Cynoglossus semilaevis]